MIVTTGLSVLACSSDSTPGETSSLTYSIITTSRESGRDDAPTVFIDGSARSQLVIPYRTGLDAVGANHRVELRAGDVVLAAIDLSGADIDDCSYPSPPRAVVAFTESVCEYDSGDLRLGAPGGTTLLADGAMGQCIIDGSASCNAECNATSCPAGRCTSIVTSHAPLYSHLGCAPSGTVPVGSACTFTAGSGGDYDDCEGGAVCISGTCVALCTGSCTCGPIEGEPPELSFCA